jgi:3,5-epimerase/4-reductase
MSIVNLQKLEIKNALQIQGVKFLDERGYFTELYNETKFEEPITERWKQVSLTNSKQDVLRGIRSSNIAKLMSCLKGLVYVVIIDLRVDSETYLKWQGVWIDGDSDKNVHLYIPRKCGHAYFCQTDAICLYLQDETYKANDDIEYNPFDNRFKIEWPKPSKAYIHKYDHSVNEIIVEQNPPILVYGSNGFLGSALIDLLKKSNESYRVGLARLENRQDLIDEINTVKPSRVICMAGIAGKPNISWFETNKIEGVRANIIGQLNVADVSNTLGLHCTILTTGVIYKYDIKHPINSGIGYKEDEEPNFDGNFYSKLRIIEEKLLDSYPYLLSLRISYPTTSDLNPNSLVSKLIKYKNIQSIPLTITMVEDLWPILLDMSKRKISGIFNFNNEGCISHDEILELYKTIVDESHEWQSTKPDLSNRAACELDVSKLKNEGYHVPHVKESMTKLMQKLKQLKDAQSNDTNKEKIEKKKKILMTGGSFYPGSKLVLELIENNYEITIIEDSNNLKEGVYLFLKIRKFLEIFTDSLLKCLDFQTELKGKVSFEHIEFYRIDTKNRNILLNFFKKNHFFAVVYQLNKPNENDSFSFDVYDESLNKTLNLIQVFINFYYNLLYFIFN